MWKDICWIRKRSQAVHILLLGGCLGAFGAMNTVSAKDIVLSPEGRDVPGAQETETLLYRNPSAREVRISGAFHDWRIKTPLVREGDLWTLNIQDLKIPEGRYEFKMIVDGEWEGGANRVLYINPAGRLERPPDLIRRAFLRRPNLIQVDFSGEVDLEKGLDITVEPDSVIARKGRPRSSEGGDEPSGFRIRKGHITFEFDPAEYGLELSPQSTVVVAGPFNQWDADGQNGRWRLNRQPGGTWALTLPLMTVEKESGSEPMDFKFVIDGHRWLEPPLEASNRAVDEKGHANLRIEPAASQTQTLLIQLEEPIQWDQPNHVVVSGLWKRPLKFIIDPLPALDEVVSEKPMGVTRRQDPQVATYRLFAPRAQQVNLLFYDQPYFEKGEDVPKPVPPEEEYRMWKDSSDGVWELSMLGWDLGRYYAFRITGPEGAGEGFRPGGQVVGDPYAEAAAHAENLPILVDTKADTEYFDGWTADFTTPDHEDLVIYEAHMRDLTSHPSSPVPSKWKGTYRGVAESLGTGTGLDHLKDLGINAVEFMPLHEFNNGPSGHDWGYTTVYFFAPEASYATKPLEGSQVYELKHLINTLHEEGMAVLIDVVYNHVGYPNLFASIDRKYYFRLNPNYTFQNFSGVGNDTRSEAPMMRRLFVESILYWMTEYKVDGFRFDLAELIDMETLLEIRDRALEINPNVILISEPWSFRGTHKFELTGTGWAAWNDNFRYTIKDFVRANASREDVMKVLSGSTDIWTANPNQAVNYVESHDDMAVVDELSLRPDKNASTLEEMDGKMGRLAATAVFTSFGIPMIHAGQEYLRSKQGISNTYNRGDPINSMDWTDRNRPIARETLKYFRDLIHFRQSKAGQTFRVPEIPEGYIRWILPEGREHALGMVLNEYGEHPGAPLAVLYNAHGTTVDFELTLPEGTWVKIADGSQMVREGLPGGSLEVRGFLQKNRVSVLGVASAIYQKIK